MRPGGWARGQRTAQQCNIGQRTLPDSVCNVFTWVKWKAVMMPTNRTTSPNDSSATALSRDRRTPGPWLGRESPVS